MKTLSTAMTALLASRQFFVADLFEFAMIGGGMLYYCSGEADISWNGVTWTAGKNTGPYFDRKDNRAKCHWKVGVEVDTLTFDLLPGSASIFGEPVLPAIRQGVFDGAEMTLYRAFMPTYGNVAAGVVTLFAGRVAEIDAQRTLATFSVNSHLELLNLNMPRNLYQSGCVNALFDSGCGLNRASYAVSGTAAAGTTATQINLTVAPATAYFDLGVIAFTSGSNSGLSRTVKTYVQGAPGSAALIAPFPTAPALGDTFQLYPGCDKQQATCSGKFSNIFNFRGFPYVPENSTAI